MTPPLSIPIPVAINELVDQAALQNYGNGVPSFNLRDQIGALSLEELFPEGVSNQEFGRCCLSGLWILHNFLDDSHSISQGIHSGEGSFWHAIMHRWEGDFANSKYWYRQVGHHPVFQMVTEETAIKFDPDEFVDRCQQEIRQGKLSDATRRIALQEWRSLFEFCFLGAQN